MRNSVLYYPKVEFTTHEWVWSALLIWDRIYRIVPEGYEPNDSEIIKEFIKKTGDKYIKNIDPKQYSKEASDIFLKTLNGPEKWKWWAAALDESKQLNKQYVELHKDKADIKLRQMLLTNKSIEKDWLYVPHDIASVYMLFLANYIAKQNNLELTTDYNEAWCGSNFFKYDGNIDDMPIEDTKEMILVSSVSEIIPDNIKYLKPEALIKFLECSQKERSKFFNEIKSLNHEIGSCENLSIIKDIITDKVNEINIAKAEYKKKLKLLKFKSLVGVKSIMVPTLTSLACNLSNINSDLSNILSLAGMGVSIIAQFCDENEITKKERESWTYDYLFELDRISSKDKNLYHHDLNNNLNHFIRD